ncbi:unnamed protein product [marine sediment metagenome]|uniref:Phage virion morphogenesis protein n=1 Tax=marine sediment metagenome TaxID=412755 RepID=X1GBQ2_9ZZZZ
MAADVRVVWYGDIVIPKVKRRLSRRLEKAAFTMAEHAKGKMRPQPTAGHGAKKRGLAPSREGEYPKRVRGWLRTNIISKLSADGMSAWVGTNVKYGRYLELGTRKMGRRPWLSLALKESTATIRRIIQHG